MIQLELTDHIVGPSGDDTNSQQADDTRDHSKSVQYGRNRKNTQTDLSLHHEDSCADPTDISIIGATFLDVTKDIITD